MPFIIIKCRKRNKNSLKKYKNQALKINAIHYCCTPYIIDSPSSINTRQQSVDRSSPELIQIHVTQSRETLMSNLVHLYLVSVTWIYVLLSTFLCSPCLSFASITTTIYSITLKYVHLLTIKNKNRNKTNLLFQRY